MTESTKKDYTGQAPYGFAWDGDRLVPEANEAAIRREAFELFLKNPVKGAVAKALSAAGHRTRRGSKIRDVTVDRWLTCSSAIGEYAVNKQRKGVSLPPEEWTVIACEPIIERSLWDAVQEQLIGPGADVGATPPKKVVSRPASDPLAPLVYCLCGTSMNLESSGLKFVCRDCGRRIPRDDLEAIVLEDVREYLANRRDLLQALVDTPEPVVEAEKRLHEHQSQIQEVEEQMSRIHLLYMSEKISVERFGELHHPLEEKRTELKTKTPELERGLSQARHDHPGRESETLDVDGLIDLWSELPYDTQQVILTELFQRVLVGDGEIELQGLLPATPLKTPTSQQTESPTNAPPTTSIDDPIYIRLPKAKERCPRTGFTKSYLNELILPTERNGFQPPVKSLNIRRKGNMRGVRLIVWESLKSYLESQEIEGS